LKRKGCSPARTEVTTDPIPNPKGCPYIITGLKYLGLGYSLQESVVLGQFEFWINRGEQIRPGVVRVVKSYSDICEAFGLSMGRSSALKIMRTLNADGLIKKVRAARNGRGSGHRQEWDVHVEEIKRRIESLAKRSGAETYGGWMEFFRREFPEKYHTCKNHPGKYRGCATCRNLKNSDQGTAHTGSTQEDQGTAHTGSGVDSTLVRSETSVQSTLHEGSRRKQEVSRPPIPNSSPFAAKNGAESQNPLRPAPTTGIEFQDRLQPGVAPEDYVNNMYHQFPFCDMGRNLKSKKEQGPGGAVEKLRAIQGNFGEEDFQYSICGFLNAHWGDLDQKRHPLYIYLANPEKYLPNRAPTPKKVFGSPRKAPAPQSAPAPAPVADPAKPPHPLFVEIQKAFKNLYTEADRPMIEATLDDPIMRDNWRTIIHKTRHLPYGDTWCFKQSPKDGKWNYMKIHQRNLDFKLDGDYKAYEEPKPTPVAPSPPAPATQTFKERFSYVGNQAAYSVRPKYPEIYARFQEMTYAISHGTVPYDYKENQPWHWLEELEGMLKKVGARVRETVVIGRPS
jgi:hypothetical protein